MTNEPSPRSWLYMCGRDVNAVFAANGALVARVETAEDAALIVAAVNERDRLRDIVRDALPFIEGAIDTVSTIIGDAEMSKAVGKCGSPPKDVLEAFVADGRRVLREARAEIGEDAP